MEPDNKYFNLRKVTAICSAFLLFFAVACNDNNEQQTETQAYEEPEQEAVVDLNDNNNQPEAQETEEEEEVEETPATPARTNYRPRITRSDNKLNLDATSMSFSDLVDENNNYIVSREDLFDGIFNTFDTEEGNSISEEEFNQSKGDFFINKQGGISNFSEWDADDNGEISKEEFHSKLNSLVDLEDGKDLPQGKYIVWDVDNDEKIEMLELENFVVRFDSNDN